MLTGENEATAKWVSEPVGLDEYFAEVLPQDKAAKVKEVQVRGILVAMTGDGVNGAPALAPADLGIAIGAGSGVAVETADVILVRSNPLDVVGILALSHATYRKMIQNLIWATSYNIVVLPLVAGALYAWGVLLTPALGAVLISASTVIVAINARMLKLKIGQKPLGKGELPAEPKPASSTEASWPPVAPKVVQRAHELDGDREREDVRAVKAWEDLPRESQKAEAKLSPYPKASILNLGAKPDPHTNARTEN